MRIEAAILAALQSEARQAAPKECCGILWRRSSSVICEFTPYPGRLFVDHFRFADDWWMKSLYDGRERSWRFAGIYHSHPVGRELFPSEADLSGHPPGTLSLIVDGGSGARAFLLGASVGAIAERSICVDASKDETSVSQNGFLK